MQIYIFNMIRMGHLIISNKSGGKNITKMAYVTYTSDKKSCSSAISKMYNYVSLAQIHLNDERYFGFFLIF